MLGRGRKPPDFADKAERRARLAVAYLVLISTALMLVCVVYGGRYRRRILGLEHPRKMVSAPTSRLVCTRAGLLCRRGQKAGHQQDEGNSPPEDIARDG